MCAGVDEYTRFCCVLTAYAESDFRSGATQVMQDGVSVTTGVFQQSSKWWPSATKGTAAQCEAFLADFTSKTRRHTGRPVEDCWYTQMWAAPDPRLDPAGFAASPETQNYVRRLPDIPSIISERRLP